MNRLSNAIRLLELLPTDYYRKQEELSEELGISKRGVGRLVTDLYDAGIYIDSKAGPSGGYKLVKNREILTNITSEEAAVLFFAAQVLSENESFSFKPQINSAIDKIRKNFNDKLADSCKEYWQQRIHYLQSHTMPVNLDNSRINVISEAIASNNSLQIEYFSMSRRAKTDRKVDPYKLVYSNGFWYMLAYCHMRGEVKVFRVDRIFNVSVSQETFDYPSSFSIQEYFKNTLGVERGEDINVVVRFSEYIAPIIRETTYHPTQVLEEQEDGSILFMAQICGVNEFLKWVLGFGADAEVLEPIKTREIMSDVITKMIVGYQLKNN